MISKCYPITKFIEDVISEVPGWTPADQLLSLHSLVLASSCMRGNILEIGSWCGRSTVILAHACKLCGIGKVLSVDLFPKKDDWKQNKDGTWSFFTENGNGFQGWTAWDEMYHHTIKPIYNKNNNLDEIFLANLKKFDVDDVVQYHIGTVKTLHQNNNYRLCFIDGDHSYHAVCTDIKYCLNNMPSGGYICFDDAFSSYDGVDRAINDILILCKRMFFRQQLTRKFHIVKILPEG